MATNAEIRTAIDEAISLAVSPSDMVALLDKAIAAAHLSGMATASYSIAGRARTIAIANAIEMRRYYAGLGGANGGMIFAGVEFSG